jgi:phosphoribosylanthranilate isomerase
VLLAGGIGPENAAQALAVPGVWGIDVCSRVESSPGVKDPARLEELFHVVRREPTVAAR